jgi:N-acetylneuraminic acid mutarotase
VQSVRGGGRSWRSEPPVPQARGGTGAAAVNGKIVSVGGEAPGGTIERVYRLDPRTRRWSRLPDLPTPRHGLGVAGLDGRVYVVAGGPQPGLFVSAANEVLLP